MLKLHYTEFGLQMEQVITDLDWAIAQQVMMAMRLHQTLHIEPSQAAFLVLAHLAEAMLPPSSLSPLSDPAIAIAAVDDDWLEVSLPGYWLAQAPDAEAGTFLTNLDDPTETLIYTLWERNTHLVAQFQR